MTGDITLDRRFRESGHEWAWKDDIGRELNDVLRQAQDSPKRPAASMLALVRRVAEFEGIEVVP